jgi:arginyl-tRNA--protein-N-Asp/Glu arginylyltransferase
MISLFTFQAPPSTCGYLPDREWSLRYEVVGALSAAEYGELLRRGWRRFGFQLFRPQCEGCRECKSIRVKVDEFAISRSQKRVRAKNLDEVTLRIGEPAVTAEKLALYDKFHAAQVERKNWPDHGRKDAGDYAESFIENPFKVEEWCYYLGDRLVGVGYVDAVPDGLSAIYFFHDPDERDRSLGTFNVLSVIASAAERGLKYVYLGYFVKGCGSLEYKAKFRPNEMLNTASGEWRTARD